MEDLNSGIRYQENSLLMSVTFIPLALYKLQIVSEQLYSDKQEHTDSVMQTN